MGARHLQHLICALLASILSTGHHSPSELFACLLGETNFDFRCLVGDHAPVHSDTSNHDQGPEMSDRNFVERIVRAVKIAQRLSPYSKNGKKQILSFFYAVNDVRRIRAELEAGTLSDDRVLEYIVRSGFHPLVLRAVF
jgi:hypothetical protein